MRWAAVIAAVAGCGSYQSTYRRTRADRSELVWAYHDGFQVTREGKVLAEQGDWDDLAGAVACVPVARLQAERAASRSHAGRTYEWTGISLIIAGVVVGSAILFKGPRNEEQAVTALAAAGGGLIIGTSLAVTGTTMRLRADMTAIDAVNLFNDDRATCRGPGAPP